MTAAGRAAVDHLEWLDAWWENYGPCGAIPGAVFPRELTTGHDVKCTARYDADGICHELEQCVLVDGPDLDDEQRGMLRRWWWQLKQNPPQWFVDVLGTPCTFCHTKTLAAMVYGGAFRIPMCEPCHQEHAPEVPCR